MLEVILFEYAILLPKKGGNATLAIYRYQGTNLVINV